MRHLEIIGAPGSGKSTLLQQLKNVSGGTVNDRDIYSLAFNSLTQATFPVERVQRGIERLFWKRYLKDRYLDNFTKEFPGLIEIIEKAGRIDKRSGYPAIYYKAAAEYICLRDLSSGRFILDEGLSQLSGEVSGLDTQLGQRFLEAIPAPDGVIHVRCSAAECLKRQEQREKMLASSLRGLDRSEAIDRLEQYNESFDSAVRILKNRGVKAVELDTEQYSTQDCYERVLSEFEIFSSK